MTTESLEKKLDDAVQLMNRFMLQATQFPTISYSELASEQNKKLDTVTATLEKLDEKLTTHIQRYNKYDSLYSLWDKTERASESISWLGGAFIRFMKFVIFIAAVWIAFWGIIKGWWVSFLIGAVKPFI
jgi:ABC-type multidrug transport system fused ATPase/permease subunit